MRFHSLRPNRGRVIEAVGPILRNEDGSGRRAVLFRVDTKIGPIWTSTTAVIRPLQPAAYVYFDSYTERTRALRAHSDRILEHTFCEECRQGDEPHCCPNDFGACRRRNPKPQRAN